MTPSESFQHVPLEPAEAAIAHLKAELATARQALGDERERSRQARESERSFKTLVDNSPDVIARFDRENRHLFVNATCAASVNRPAALWVGKTHAELGYPPAVVEIMTAGIQRAFATAEPQVAEVTTQRVTGTSHLEVRFSPELEGGEVASVMIVARDSTARKRAESELAHQFELLRQSEAHKDQFLGILCHELRTPINAIMGFGSILEDGLAGDLNAQQLAYLARISDASEHLLALVNDLLDMSRVQAGKFTIVPEPVAIAQLAGDAIATVAAAARAKDQALINELPPDLPGISADPRRVVQVLTNLLTNASKYSPVGSRITVGASLEGEWLRVSVADNGIGIPAGELERIFQPFTQVDMSSTRLHGGVGLGLGIVRALVEAHGGKTGVESTPGEGSLFWFTLPSGVR